MSTLESLVTSAEAGKLPAVRKAIKAHLAEGGSLEDYHPEGSPALHCAAFEGHTSVVKALIAAGARPDFADGSGFLPLHVAVSKNRLSTVKVLVGHGSLDAQTPAGGTPLHVAAAYGFAACAKALIGAGATVDLTDARGRTPLHEGASRGHLALVKQLLSAGADPNHPGEGRTPLAVAINHAMDCKRSCKGWSSQGMVNGRPRAYKLENGDLLMSSGEAAFYPLPFTEVKQISKLSWGPPALKPYVAAIDVIGALLKGDANPEAADLGGGSSLHMLAELGESKLLKSVGRNKQLDWTAPDDSGTTPVHYAARSKRAQGLQAVLKLVDKAAVNTQNAQGLTPAHFLGDVGGSVDMARALRRAGADFSLKSTADLGQLPAGSTAADFARHWKDPEMAEALSP